MDGVFHMRVAIRPERNKPVRAERFISRVFRESSACEAEIFVPHAASGAGTREENIKKAVQKHVFQHTASLSLARAGIMYHVMPFGINLNVGDLIGSAKKMLEKNESVIGLDIGSAFIKVIQVRKDQGRAILETYGELALGPYGGLDVGRATNLPTEKIVEAGRDIFREANVTTKVGSISLPLSAALLTLIEVPAMDEGKLAQIIPIEARKYIPVPISEVALDWVLIPKSVLETGDDEEEKEEENPPAGGAAAGSKRKETLEVMIVAIHNQVLNKYQDIVRELGIERATFEIEVYSSIRATIGHDMAPIMFMDMGAGMTKLSMVEHGILKNVHIVSRGSQEVTLALSRSLNVSVAKAEGLKRDIGLSGRDEDAKKISSVVESTIGYIFAEANRVLLNYQSKHNRTVSKVVLTGGGALLKGLPDYAKKWLDAEVHFGDAFAKLESPAFLTPLLKEAGPEFSVAIGLALKKLQESV